MITAVLALALQLGVALPRQGPPPAIVTRAPLDSSQTVNFRVLVSPDTVYVGQQTTYELGVFLDASVRDRLRRMEAIAPEMRGLMAYDPPAPLSGFPARVLGSHRFEAHVYQRAVFPLGAGRLVIAPARLVYAMPLSYSFFSREESYEVRSDSVTVVVLEPPRATRPAEWNGAVGTVSVSARLDTSAARVGDPVMLTVSVTGRGNVKLFPRPAVDVPWASVVPGDERVRLSADSLDVHGTKEFDWVLTPRRAGRLTIPAVRYAYFDPLARRYVVTATEPLPMTVGPGTLAGDDTARPAHRAYTIRASYRGALAEPPYRRPSFWWVMLLAPTPALVLSVARRRRRPRRAAADPARRLRALARDGRAADMREVRRLFLLAAAARLRVTVAAITEPELLRHAARRAGASPDAAAAAAALLRALDTAAFSPGAAPLADAAPRAWRAYGALDAESRRFRPSAAAALAALALVAGMAGAHALGGVDDAAQFASGVRAYEHGRFSIAERDFAAVADRVPRAADAWANAGTAALAAGDTALATAGWERALRLEPTADDARDRLERLGASTTSGAGAVPQIPALPVALLAAMLWVGSWLFIAWRIACRRPRGALSLAAGAAAGALALAAAAVAIDRQTTRADVAVVAHDTSLHLLPSLASDRGATVRTGEIARIAEREGAWVRLVADDGRDGWTVADAVVPIAHD